ncbi:hypothetical protein A9Q88_09225 [Gammaproteobacteria bacterium 50_400_T64]|nr:hypothetical protein A9Q88_09225 [Gammaproteobacteria bacterium 50_400_T64]
MTSTLLLNNVPGPEKGSITTSTKGATRHIVDTANYSSVIDDFGNASAIFVRVSVSQQFKLDASYHFSTIAAGGFLGIPDNDNQPLIWVPCLPTSRRVNSSNAILEEKPCRLSNFAFSADEGITFDLTRDDASTNDLVIWLLTPDFPIQELTSQSAIESHGTFLWGSHGCITDASDLYRHLIHGAVYDLRYSWPHNKKCFSENEAHALYTAYSGLEKATGKTLYRYFQQQIVLSVIQRQADDGAWYHGMWTDETECHYRLHTSAVHLLMDEFDRSGCEQVKTALEKGVAFLAQTHDQLDCGIWFLHDSLELNDEAMNSGPFQWISNGTLGKRPSNMLVLNTHLDTTIAINRYQTLTGDRQYSELIKSALVSTHTVLALQPANWLYKPLFWAISLTMLPTDKARQLAAPVRAIKRIAADYLIKKLPDIKARFPRIVMPNGYIDRELSLRTWAVDYQTINLMDLARYARAFPSEFDETILDKAMGFTHDIGLIQRYRELAPGKRYATGFWVEALYHRCLAKDDVKYRQWLAEAMQECHDLGFGMAPSLLGTNSEAVPFAQQSLYPVPANPELNIAVLSRTQGYELLIVNHSQEAVDVRWDRKPDMPMNWCDATQQPLANEPLTIPPRQWLLGSTSL